MGVYWYMHDTDETCDAGCSGHAVGSGTRPRDTINVPATITNGAAYTPGPTKLMELSMHYAPGPTVQFFVGS